MTSGARAIIRLDAIRRNLRTIKSASDDAKVMAVVKANAYGHGMCEVAAALAEADCLAVARVSEAVTLREYGIDAPIAVLSGVFSEAELADAASLDLQVCVHDAVQLDWLERSTASPLIVWLKVDTGMNRLGFRPAVARDALQRLTNCAAVTELRLMTHLANADNIGDAMTDTQLERFLDVARDFTGHVGIANSAAILAAPQIAEALREFHDEGRLWVRSGLALYGISPFGGEFAGQGKLEPAMTFESTLVSVKDLPAGECVGYGGTWRAENDTVLGIVGVGYGDGYSRFIPAGAPVRVNGRTVPVIGRISMDLCAVDLGCGAQDRCGDRVILWGDDLPIENLARSAGTIPYELLTGVAARVPRQFEH